MATAQPSCSGELAQRPDRDARRLHVDEQEADPLVLGRIGVGAHEQEAPVGDVRHRRPDLLAVDDEMLAVQHAARLEVGEVGARVRLRESLAPQLVGGQDLLQMPRLLGRRAVLHQRRAEHREPAAVDELGRLGARHFLEEDDLLGERGAAAAELLRPVHADVAGLPHRLLPGAQPPDLVDVRPRRRERLPPQVVRHVALEPRPNLLPKRLLLLAELEIHSSTSPAGHSRTGRSRTGDENGADARRRRRARRGVCRIRRRRGRGGNEADAPLSSPVAYHMTQPPSTISA